MSESLFPTPVDDDHFYQDAAKLLDLLDDLSAHLHAADGERSKRSAKTLGAIMAAAFDCCP